MQKIQFVDTDAQAHKILHVVTKLSEKPGTPGFDPHAKQEMEEAIAKMLRSNDKPCPLGQLQWLRHGVRKRDFAEAPPDRAILAEVDKDVDARRYMFQ
jgi:hypothetical protein